MMTVPTGQSVDTTRRSEEAVTTAVHTWADTVQNYASKLVSGQSHMPDLKDVVDEYFDFAEKVLAKQREFAQQWASATIKATQAVTEQAQRATQSVAARTANGTEAVVDNAAKTARVAAEKVAETARAADDAATT
jgi:hypothetical protein